MSLTIETAGVKALVDRGIALESLLAQHNAELDEIKDRLRREAALQRIQSTTSTSFLGDNPADRATVVYPLPTYTVDETRVDELRDLLGTYFDVYFEATVVYTTRVDYPIALAGMTPPKAQVMSGIVMQNPNTPVITFSKGAN